MYRSNKSGKASKPKAKRIKPSGPPMARVLRTMQAGALLAPKVMSKLRYSAIVTHSNGVADAGLYQFRLNSVFDPDYTSAGSQPPYFDRMALIYGAYRVLACKYQVRSTYNSGTNQVVVVWPQSVATSVTSLQSALCQTTARCNVATPYTDPNANKIKGYLPMAKVFGVERLEIETDSDYGALTSTNPNKVAYLNLYSGNQTGTSTSDCQSLVELTYYVEWSQPVPDNMN